MGSRQRRTTLQFGVYTLERLALYGQILKIVANDVPYVIFYTHASDLALAPKFKWPGFNQYFYTAPWALNIRNS